MLAETFCAETGTYAQSSQQFRISSDICKLLVAIFDRHSVSAIRPGVCLRHLEVRMDETCRECKPVS